MKIRDNQTGEDVTPEEFAKRWDEKLRTPGPRETPAAPHKAWLFYNVLNAVEAIKYAGKEMPEDFVVGKVQE